jgi:hypothetical protein
MIDLANLFIVFLLAGAARGGARTTCRTAAWPTRATATTPPEATRLRGVPPERRLRPTWLNLPLTDSRPG